MNAHKKRIFFAILFFLLVLFFLVLGTSPLNKDKLIEPLLQAKPHDVVSISIEPFKYIRLKNNLVEAPITISDKRLIEEICSSFNDAKPWNPARPFSVWRAVLAIKKKDKIYYCDIGRLKKNNDNGLAIRISSRREWGWALGTFRSDSLGTIIESMVITKKSITKIDYNN